MKHFTKLFDSLVDFDDVKSDITSRILSFGLKRGIAKIIFNESGLLAGMEEIKYYIEKRTEIKFINELQDGSKINKGICICELHGSLQEILKYERLILNVLQRLSGIATQTNKLVTKSFSMRIAATRKTHWGWLDKKAVSIGGGLTHRLSLADGILVKDNHIDLLSKERKKAIKMILDSCRGKLIEIEVESSDEAIFALDEWHYLYALKPIIIMLDNFSIQDANKTIMKIKSNNIVIELSGGINKQNIAKYKQTEADVISIGALTHSATALDMSLQFA
ncbi:nicotinate-nucleotide diphosphorylase (carboxylating) [Candidatus Roizmanbacteria bacterium RIFCSPHIGHO2_02_FULL_37_13b]|uniref:nicotinate-nucleotide diphosphorylase (carboxylating) n=1 Tax=Candidatus Roizmanbacteria bacterium RIFCSPLOWO2_02_FULL_36_11 TaxID=1802071 RepID=A0A1F7JBE5_9BACT|nr:MAG: nicotinate-nucleotide diphosphorylase (carboxylating) [Candidatus Roizmanbacteria bacterium RIFCSPHIGHO2_02_FULL_37_13b]OGK52930.1 MAG: nicotinate-nucleotide diphosphorylase (carboxylating) [Candidatus Roizmanbacteria bacterium RIFCSPLOWO2_02_FULL_36_11]